MRKIASTIGGADEVPFVNDITDILSSLVCLMGNSMLSSSPDMTHSSNFDCKIFKKHVRACGACRKIAQCGIE